MQPTLGEEATTSTQPSLAALEPVLRHLAHDLRQPLSGIESIAYYLDMVLADAEPEIGQHCERLRRMVQQANWILNDASLAARVFAGETADLDLQSYFRRLGARYAVQEDCSLDLHFEDGLPAAVLPAQAPRFFEHLVAFVRDVALAQDPIRVEVSRQGHEVRVTISAQVLAEPAEVLRMIDTPSPASGVRRFLEQCGSPLEARIDEGVLRLGMALPAVEQA